MMKYGLIGRSLAHSYSKMIHAAIGSYEYDLIELEHEQLAEFMTERKFCGINITIPYKKDVIPYCYEISPIAAHIGSVNTIINRGGKLYGYNTDYRGFLYMARRAGIDFADKKVLILGGGGTSLTVRRAAYDGGAGKIVTVSRTGAVNYNNVYTHHDADIIVNTTPVGMYPDNSGEIIDLRGFDKLCGVIDVIYNPLNTNLTLQAKRLGIPSSGGLPMLVAQAVFAAELFTGETFSGDVTEKVLSDVMKDILNIVLIGMPGSGKTAVGKIIAQKLGREFIDTDSEVERASKMPIPDIFKAYGEDYFRALEAQAVRKAAAKCAVVISTGGGVPMSEANRRAIAQNGFTCYIERELEKLQTDGRPLSAGANALTDMYDRRHPLYLSMCDIRYKAGEGRLDEAADYIIGQFLRTV